MTRSDDIMDVLRPIYRDDYLMPYASTQYGIADACNMTRAQVSVLLRKLGQKNLVGYTMAHVNGLSSARRYRCYYLTKSGIEYSKIKELVKEQVVCYD